ncbi:MAG: Loki-CTERM sorting domain-containing protein [Candidatus Hodarchaeota archaeon]
MPGYSFSFYFGIIILSIIALRKKKLDLK